MSELFLGAQIVLFVVIASTIAGFIETGTESTSTLDGCTVANNVTTCEAVGKEDFFSSAFTASINGFTGAPGIVNALWLSIMGSLLTVGILLIVKPWIPFLGGSA